MVGSSDEARIAYASAEAPLVHPTQIWGTPARAKGCGRDRACFGRAAYYVLVLFIQVI
jgi:hypothetical protein